MAADWIDMSLYQQILASLSGMPTQNDRLLVLHTPLGHDVLLAERAQIDESIGLDANADARTGLRIVVHALAADTHIELKRLIGQPALLELLTAANRSELRPFHGHITEAALVGSDGGLARYRLVIEPWLAFLAHRTDSYVFQRASVVQIVDEVFADYQAQGTLVPAWRWDLADPLAYAERSLSIQYQESDLDFVARLLREEGLFSWFEHTGDARSPALGSHTLVIADHNGAFRPSAQPLVRYTQAGAVLPADSLTRWRREAAVQTASLELASLDHRSRSLRPQAQSADPATGSAPLAHLTLTDIPGAYAYEDGPQGERLALRQMQALDAQRERITARGTLRSAAPGTTFTLLDHPVHDGLDAGRDQFVTLAVRHTARSNLSAHHRAQVLSLVGAIAQTNARGRAGHSEHPRAGAAPHPDLANATDEPLYTSRLTAQRAAVPVRMAALDQAGLPDPRLHTRPTIHGVQTAIVVGSGTHTGTEPIHTDRDHRIKVQFHWQRGAHASHRLTHPATDNAPASDASGTWVRVAQSVAGANWGAVFTPRVGQEVLVQFVAGDIDRPVVIGAVYNGRGNENAQGNHVAGGAAGASGNAVAWFPGSAASGPHQGHQHGAVMAGYKSQEMSTSQSGSGGHNQLVFDDSAGAGRIELGSTSAATRLQLGHLLHQNDNQRLQPRGHGLDLTTAAWGAVRAGSGLLLSAHGRPGSQSASRQLDSREPQTQIEQSQQLLHTLAESAQQHNAQSGPTGSEPNVIGAKRADTARQLPAEQAMVATLESLGATDQRSASATAGEGGSNSGISTGNNTTAGDGSAATVGGGTGSVTAWGRADLVIAAPGGIGAFTPASSVLTAGNTGTFVAGQDLQHAAQANSATAVKGGLVFYTYGKAQAASKPNTETGIALHAASGNVNTQSQSGATRLTADRAIDVSSSTGMVKVAAPNHVLLTAAGAAIDMQPGSITLKGPGKIEFRAAMKVLTGAGSASQSLTLKKPGEFHQFNEAFVVKDEETGEVMRHVRYRIEDAQGAVLAQGTTDASGKTLRVHTAKAEQVKLVILDT